MTPDALKVTVHVHSLLPLQQHKLLNAAPATGANAYLIRNEHANDQTAFSFLEAGSQNM